jgi:hypothetical protein
MVTYELSRGGFRVVSVADVGDLDAAFLLVKVGGDPLSWGSCSGGGQRFPHGANAGTPWFFRHLHKRKEQAAVTDGPASASARLMASYEAEYDLDETQRAAVRLAGEHLDEAERLDAVVRKHGHMIAGSTGQLVLNPAITEARQQRAAAWNVLKNLLADDGGAAVDAASMGQADSGHAMRSPASIRASKAVRARWDRARAQAGGDAA